MKKIAIVVAMMTLFSGCSALSSGTEEIDPLKLTIDQKEIKQNVRAYNLGYVEGNQVATTACNNEIQKAITEGKITIGTL